jgi:hypothetical protein
VRKGWTISAAISDAADILRMYPEAVRLTEKLQSRSKSVGFLTMQPVLRAEKNAISSPPVVLPSMQTRRRRKKPLAIYAPSDQRLTLTIGLDSSDAML